MLARLRRLNPTRLVDALRRPELPDRAVLGLHGIADRIDDPDVQLNQVETAEFEALVAFLRRAFQVVPLSTLIAADAPRAVALTFDDGYTSTRTIAKPLLEGAGLPFTVFVPTAYIEDGSRLPTYTLRTAIFHTRRPTAELGGRTFALGNRAERKAAMEHGRVLLKRGTQEEVERLLSGLRDLLSADEWAELDDRFASERLMSWDELADLGAPVGAHTHDHAILHGRQPLDEVRRQLVVSLELLERRLDNACRDFCYPHGTAEDIAPAAVAELRALGYTSGVTSIPGVVAEATPRWFLPRLPLAGTFERQHERLHRLHIDDRRYRRIARSKGLDV